MIKVFTKEKISKVIITHLFTREEINLHFEGNVFVDHPELNPQDYIVLDDNNDFIHPTFDENLQTIREMTYEETKLLEIETLADGEYIEAGELIIVKYDESLGYYKRAWNKETHVWYEGATEEELKTEYYRLINSYKATVFPGPYAWQDGTGKIHYQHSRADKDVGLLNSAISYLERHPSETYNWQFSDNDEYALTLAEAYSLLDAGVVFVDSLFEAERQLKSEIPNVKLTLENFKDKFNQIYQTMKEVRNNNAEFQFNLLSAYESKISDKNLEIKNLETQLKNKELEIKAKEEILQEQNKTINELSTKLKSLDEKVSKLILLNKTSINTTSNIKL